MYLSLWWSLQAWTMCLYVSKDLLGWRCEPLPPHFLLIKVPFILFRFDFDLKSISIISVQQIKNKRPFELQNLFLNLNDYT